jgi:hypothetical protein
MMKTISKAAHLGQIYTNHSVRATHMCILDEAGFEARHIMRTSGHKNEASIRSYSHRLSERKKRDIAETLAESAGLQPKPSAAQGHPPPSTSQSSVIQKKAKCVPTPAKKPMSIYEVGQSAPHNQQDEDISDLDLMAVDLSNVPVEIMNDNRAIKNSSMNFCPSLVNCTGVTFNFYGGAPAQFQK